MLTFGVLPEKKINDAVGNAPLSILSGCGGWQRTASSSLQGYKKTPSPWDHHTALGIVRLYGPREALFLMSEIPL